MKIPDCIDIKGNIWQIKWVKDLDNGDNWGECDTGARVITMDRNVPANEKDTVFLHEVFHAIIHEIGGYNTKLSDDLEEIIVTNFSEWLTQNCKLGLKK